MNRGALWFASFLCKRSMPCAARSKSQLGSESSAPILGNHVLCRGGCGDRLNGTYGHHNVASKNEMHRLCPVCFEKAGAGGRSADGVPNLTNCYEIVLCGH